MRMRSVIDSNVVRLLRSLCMSSIPSIQPSNYSSDFPNSKFINSPTETYKLNGHPNRRHSNGWLLPASTTALYWNSKNRPGTSNTTPTRRLEMAYLRAKDAPLGNIHPIGTDRLQEVVAKSLIPVVSSPCRSRTASLHGLDISSQNVPVFIGISGQGRIPVLEYGIERRELHLADALDGMLHVVKIGTNSEDPADSDDVHFSKLAVDTGSTATFVAVSQTLPC
ncbi:hypothetical protein B0H11DRAFT_46034 [Mycena galericulata]|nr:hypothetical protein B0H11DRAFT_46034 [Mycena galericulata]